MSTAHRQSTRRAAVRLLRANHYTRPFLKGEPLGRGEVEWLAFNFRTWLRSHAWLPA
jgi:hypothetical protein